MDTPGLREYSDSMCARYITKDQAAIESYYRVLNNDWGKYLGGYNISPTQQVPVIRFVDGSSHGSLFRWGLVPSWAKGKADPKYPNVNATIEKVKDGPVWRTAWKRAQRCIMPAVGFYEWHVNDDGSKQPFCIQVRDQPVFGFAGLWDASTKDDGETIHSCTIITMPANSLMAAIHNTRERMPAILARQDIDAWLNGSADDAFDVLKQYPADSLNAFPVSTRVNNSRNQGPELIAPVEI